MDRQEYIQEVREGIARELFDVWIEDKEDWEDAVYKELPEKHKREYRLTANRILSDPRIALIDPEQELPEIPYIDELEYGDATCFDFRWGAHVAQKEMRDKFGFKRAIPKEEYVKEE